MTARQHMALIVEATGLYQLTGSTPADWELSAAGAGFALIEAQFDRLLEDLFVDTASRERIAQWEKLFRAQTSTAVLEDCRETVGRRFSSHPDDVTLEKANRLLPGAGVRGLLLENEEGGLTMVLGRLLGVNQAEAERELNQLLPAHLAWQWDQSVTWVALDAYPRSFADWDALGLSWTQLDQVTRADLENNFEEDG